ncbi:hypothetical protein PJI19_29660, partial [Mycobacterium kansasii]
CGEAQIVPAASAPTFQATDSDPALAFEWQFIFTGLGFGVGAGVVLVLVMLSKQGRLWWDKCIDELLIMILPTFRINH